MVDITYIFMLEFLLFAYTASILFRNRNIDEIIEERNWWVVQMGDLKIWRLNKFLHISAQKWQLNIENIKDTINICSL